MKKLYTLLMSGVIAAGAMAQSYSSNSVPTTPRTVTNNIRFDKSKLQHGFGQHPTTQAPSLWLNYAYAKDSIYSNVGVLNANYLSWDSLQLGDFGGTYAPVWINSLGNVLDLKSPDLQFYGGYSYGPTDIARIDSIGLVYAYTRNYPNPLTVDTLVVTLYTNVPATNFLASGYIGTTAQNYGTDTVTAKFMKYTYQTNLPNATGQVVYKFPLTLLDTAVTYYRAKAFSTNMFPVPSGNKIVGTSITFKPGYPYQLNDSIDNNNAFFFTSYEEQGTGTYPTYTDCNYQSAACDYNVSSIIRTAERYNISTNYNGLYIPKWAFTQPYSLENHLIDYYVTINPAGVNENKNENSTLFQNVPNPFNGNSTISYELVNGGNVSLDIYDITGKSVASYNQGKQASGRYSVEVSGSALQPGVYFYTLTVDGSKSTKKMTVIR